jgi:hypothetical protein
MTAAALLLAGVSLLASSVLSVALLWTGRRVADAFKLQGALDTLRKEHRNLDEIFEAYRKRDAQRVSTATQRRKKSEAEELEEVVDFDESRFRLTGTK